MKAVPGDPDESAAAVDAVTSVSRRQALAHMGSDAGAADAVADCGVDRVMLQLFFTDLEAVHLIGRGRFRNGLPLTAAARNRGQAGSVA